jgi:serine/threonine protein kinase
MSPEIVGGHDYDNSVDLWSIGILTYELTTGTTPFYQQSKDGIKKKILEGQFDFPKYLSDEVKEFIAVCLKYDPKQRIGINQMLQHRWIQKHLKESLQYDRNILNPLVKLLK